jgi:hypothetical protein
MAAALPDTKRPRDVLTGTRRRAQYNSAEQEFSICLQERLEELLQGKRNCVALLRRYPHDPGRLGLMPTPPSVDRQQLRLRVVETLVWDAINFVRLKAAGGPVAQRTLPDGSVLELQTFPTKFPHIVIERTDRYIGEDNEPAEMTWSIQRLQNQRAQTQFNRLLDAANLLFDIFRAVR